MRCQDYDYIEIACLYHYPVSVTLASGEMLEGQARDTYWNDAREECLVLVSDAGEQEVLLSQVRQLDVLVENPHFRSVRFN
ncbi:Rho-binding antiterminator [Marinobacter hydrocarbonoclasticus]|nr:Rho-binding antiterminator [Marinobacter nauticus]